MSKLFTTYALVQERERARSALVPVFQFTQQSTVLATSVTPCSCQVVSTGYLGGVAATFLRETWGRSTGRGKTENRFFTMRSNESVSLISTSNRVQEEDGKLDTLLKRAYIQVDAIFVIHYFCIFSDNMAITRGN